MTPAFELHLGDCLDVMAGMEPNSVDTIITDPPYGLEFMGKDWDHGVPGVHFWEAAYCVAKPGAMLLAFGGTRTFHRLTCAIEDAGWEIRDCLMWLYGSGFPKSHDISKAIDKAAGAEREVVGVKRSGLAMNRNLNDDGWHNANGTEEQKHIGLTAPATPAAAEWQGWGTALKPAWEPIILAMKPLDGTFAQNALRHGVAGLHVDGGRIQTDAPGWRREGGMHDIRGGKFGAGTKGRNGDTVQEMSPAGRWPANVLLDEDAAAALDQMSGETTSSGGLTPGIGAKDRRTYQGGWGEVLGQNAGGLGDTGGASRFFYVAKASRAERERGLEGMPERVAGRYGEMGQGPDPKQTPSVAVAQRNHHPTVKPLKLMEYLCTLTATPTGGVVLDPFMGSGTTGVACMQTGRKFIGCEIDAGYFEIAKRRIEDAAAQLPLPLEMEQ